MSAMTKGCGLLMLVLSWPAAALDATPTLTSSGGPQLSKATVKTMPISAPTVTSMPLSAPKASSMPMQAPLSTAKPPMPKN